MSDSCKKCPIGSFVNLSDAPGKSHFDCKACPTGESLDYIWFNSNIPAADLERELSHLRRIHDIIAHDKTIHKL